MELVDFISFSCGASPPVRNMVSPVVANYSFVINLKPHEKFQLNSIQSDHVKLWPKKYNFLVIVRHSNDSEC